jgi:hypothetical protein
MAFTGLHVEFGYQKKGAVNPSPILGRLVSSEDPASQVATTGGAPQFSTDGDPMVNLSASADSWVSFGQPPADPSLPATPRRLVRAGVPLPCFVNPGDNVRWVAA